MKSPLNRPSPARPVTRVSLQALAPNPRQPRRSFPERGIAELAQSIRRFGLLSPLLVRRIGAGRYELIAGERRLRALRLLGETEADAIVISAFDCDSALLALIENLQREGLHYLEEAEACQAILREHGLTQEALAERLGRSPSALANRLRLLRLPAAVRELVRTLDLSERHARALLRLEDEGDMLYAARTAGEKRLTVRQTEALVERLRTDGPAPKRAKPMTRYYRDQRMSVNAVLDTVKALNQVGVAATSRVETREDCIEVIVRLPLGTPLPRK